MLYQKKVLEETLKSSELFAREIDGSNGKRFVKLDKNVRGKDLSKNYRLNPDHQSDKKRSNYTLKRANRDKSLRDIVKLEISEKSLCIYVEDAINKYPLELYQKISSRQNKVFINRACYKKLMDSLNEKYPDFERPTRNSERYGSKPLFALYGFD